MANGNEASVSVTPLDAKAAAKASQRGPDCLSFGRPPTNSSGLARANSIASPHCSVGSPPLGTLISCKGQPAASAAGARDSSTFAAIMHPVSRVLQLPRISSHLVIVLW